MIEATYTPLEELWNYRLSIKGLYDIQTEKRSSKGKKVKTQNVVQDIQTRKTHLDFSVLPGDENPAIIKTGETIKIRIFQNGAMIASLVFHREADHSLIVKHNECNIAYIP